MTSFAEKFELLLDMFPVPDRLHLSSSEERRWRNSEISEASGARLSTSYLSALRRAKIEDPGFVKLDLLAQIMGFPTELWVLEPAEWTRKLEDIARDGLRPERFAYPHKATPLDSFKRQLLSRESQDLDEDELEVTLQFVRQLKTLRTKRGAGV